MTNLAAVKRYIWLSAIPAVVIAIAAAALSPYSASITPWLYPLVIAIAWAGELYRVQTRHNSSHNLSAAIHLPLILLLTPIEAISLAAIGSICSQVRRQRPLHSVTYNAVVRVIAVGVPAIGLMVWRLHDHRFDRHRGFLTAMRHVDMAHPTSGASLSQLPFGAEMAVGCMLAALLYFALDSALIATVVAVRGEVSPINVWQTNLQAFALPELTMSVLGIIAACLAIINPIFLVFVTLPVFVAHITTKAILRLERETIDAITTLADSIDQRDPYTARHSERVAVLSRRLARRLGFSREQVEEIELAARVHDLGKMSTPNEILLKNGPLTAEEMAVMQRHSCIGAQILQKYHNFQKSAPIVLHHHERYDGKGYPDGLCGGAIPMGARIVAQADAYDAMVSDRPYRRGMRPEIALQRVGEATGTQFDPEVAGAFISMMREELTAAGRSLPTTGGSIAEGARSGVPEDETKNVRYLYREDNG